MSRNRLDDVAAGACERPVPWRAERMEGGPRGGEGLATSLASAVDFMANEIWGSFKAYCDSTEEPDRQNTAYFHSHHEPVIRL
jgi:hypothetical protein